MEALGVPSYIDDDSGRKMRTKFDPFWFTIVICFILPTYLAHGEQLNDYRTDILKTLHSIKSYEMTVQYSESVNTPNEVNPYFRTTTSTEIVFNNPYYLYMNAIGEVSGLRNGKEDTQNLHTYTTFDGEYQKARSTTIMNGNSSTQSVVLELSINSPDDPFNGWNISGYGLLEGKDYIKTIEVFMGQYDFVKINENNDIIELLGNVNSERLTAMLPEDIPPEIAEHYIETVSNDREFSIQIDKKTYLVTGYTLIDQFGNDVAMRVCKFTNIKVNHDIDPSIFDFQSLPGKEFIDITDSIREMRNLK